MDNRYLKTGYAVSPHGLRGEIKVKFFKIHVPAVKETLYLEKGNDLHGPFEIFSLRKHRDTCVLKLKGIDSIEQAEKYNGYSIGVSPEARLGNAFFIDDMIGCGVFSIDGSSIGRLTEVLKTGAANDVYIVKASRGKEYLIPAVRSVVESVDIPGKRIVINPIPGMLEPLEEDED